MWEREVFDMLASQRHNQIQNLLEQNGAVTIAGLMETFGISMETARRDLAAMEKAGLLARVHGGALPLSTARFYRPLKERMQDQLSQKQAIARAAVEYVREGDFISVSAGSTALAFAKELRKHIRKLTVVTYSLDVFELLHDLPEYTVLLTGGEYYEKERAFKGPAAAAFLSGVYVQKAFLFPSALSLEAGITCRTKELVSRQTPMIHRCDQVFVLADSSKFQKNVFYQVTPLRQDFIIITDKGLPEELQKRYADNHLHVIYADE